MAQITRWFSHSRKFRSRSRDFLLIPALKTICINTLWGVEWAHNCTSVCTRWFELIGICFDLIILCPYISKLFARKFIPCCSRPWNHWEIWMNAASIWISNWKTYFNNNFVECDFLSFYVSPVVPASSWQSYCAFYFERKGSFTILAVFRRKVRFLFWPSSFGSSSFSSCACLPYPVTDFHLSHKSPKILHLKNPNDFTVWCNRE